MRKPPILLAKRPISSQVNKKKPKTYQYRYGCWLLLLLLVALAMFVGWHFVHDDTINQHFRFGKSMTSIIEGRNVIEAKFSRARDQPTTTIISQQTLFEASILKPSLSPYSTPLVGSVKKAESSEIEKTSSKDTGKMHDATSLELVQAGKPFMAPTKAPVRSQKKKKPPRDPPLYNFESEWGYKGEHKYIKVNYLQDKIPLKKDRRVVFTNISVINHFYRDNRELPSDIPGNPRELQKANAILRMHPMQIYTPLPHENTLEDAMIYVKNSPSCTSVPLFLTMATGKCAIFFIL
jgi:hypothetical protein